MPQDAVSSADHAAGTRPGATNLYDAGNVVEPDVLDPAAAAGEGTATREGEPLHEGVEVLDLPEPSGGLGPHGA